MGINFTPATLLPTAAGTTPGGTTITPSDQATNVRFDFNQFFIEYNRDQTSVNTYFPILMKRMPGLMNNIEISGSMQTDYTRLAGVSSTHGYSFIQVGKQSQGTANALGGYGVAWKPILESSVSDLEYIVTNIKHSGTGAYDLTIQAPGWPTGGFGQEVGYLRIPYRETGNYIFVPVQFGQYGAGYIVSKCLIGNEELMEYAIGAGNMSLYMTRPNVYIVDFTSSVHDISMWDNMDDEMGFLSFINCGVADIRPNIRYQFMMNISEDNGLVFTLNMGETELFRLTSAARIPLYEISKVEYADAIGISVYGTGGRKWYYDDIRIANKNNQYPYLYCTFTTEGLRDEIYINAAARGYTDNSDRGVTIYAAQSDGKWANIGAHISESMETISSDVISLADYTYRNKVHVLILGMYPGDETGNSYIEIDDISLENNESISVPLGGCIDAYIEADTIEEELAFTTNPYNGEINIDNSEYGIVYIKKLYRDGVELFYGRDYTIIANEYTFTARGTISILTPFLDEVLTMDVRIMPTLLQVQSQLSTFNNRAIDYDLLVRPYNIHMVNIESVNREDMMSTLEDFVSTAGPIDETKSIEMSGLIRQIRAQGIDVSDLVVTERYYADGKYTMRHYSQSTETISADSQSIFVVDNG